MPDEPVTVSVVRTVRPGREADFERALHEFVQRSLRMPGQLGVHILRPAPGTGSRDYGILRKFASREALDAFRRSPEYAEWTRLAADLTEGEPRFEELCGLESWFTLPDQPLRPLPKWKMALVTFAGVYPTVTLLQMVFGEALSSLPPLLAGVIFNAGVVTLLTWLVMPALTRLTHGWLGTTSP